MTAAGRRRIPTGLPAEALPNVAPVKLSMMISYSGDFHADVGRVQELEAAGLDLVWVPEAYSFDSVSQMGYLAAKTSTIQIGAGILNTYSRTATCIAQTAAGLDYVSDGRFVLGLGASGPQVIEGFHGVPYDKPMARIRDYINICRMTWRARTRRVRQADAVHDPAAGRPGHRARQATQADQPSRARRHPDLLGVADGTVGHRHRPVRRRLVADLLRPGEVPHRLGRRAREGHR